MDVKNYVWKIFEKKDFLEKLQNGYLVQLDAKDDIPKKWVDDFNSKVRNNDVLNLDQEYFDGETKDNLLGFCNGIKRILQSIDNDIATSKNDFIRSFTPIKEDLNKCKESWKKSCKKDQIQTKENAENTRMHDLSTGIFSTEEANGRSFFNIFVKPYKSSTTRELEQEFEDKYKRLFSYAYFMFEESTYIALSMIQTKPKRLNWTKKFECVNKLPIGKDIEKGTAERIMHVANFYKHQQKLPWGFEWPSLKEVEKFILDIYKKLDMNSGFRSICISMHNFDSEVGGVLNPLGLTGFE